MIKGIIALDIDGTLTEQNFPIAVRVLHFLQELIQQGWALIFITGRTFTWAYSVLESLKGPYALAVQNGATILQMPNREVLLQRHLSATILSDLEQIYYSEPSDYVLYSGYTEQDRCFYRPSHFEPKFLEKLMEIRVGILREEWQAVETFDQLTLQSFASAKGFGLKESAERISQKIEARLGLHAPVIRDPFLRETYIVQATHSDVDKGKALSLYAETFPQTLLRIAAGDDLNDLTMFAAADYRIVMETAPEQLLAYADVIAPAVNKHGIIKGLKQVLQANERGLMPRRIVR